MIKCLLCVVGIGAVLYHLFPIVTVCGDSMYPTFKDGEIILATRLFRKSKLKKGDVVIYHAPNDGHRVVIKRIDKINTHSGVMYCLGDNSEVSYDSRMYGYVSLRKLVCKPIKQRVKAESEVANNE